MGERFPNPFINVLSLIPPPPPQKKTKPTFLLISEVLNKLALIMKTGGTGGKGWQEGLGSSTKKGELFLMQYTDIKSFGDYR